MPASLPVRVDSDVAKIQITPAKAGLLLELFEEWLEPVRRPAEEAAVHLVGGRQHECRQGSSVANGIRSFHRKAHMELRCGWEPC